MLSPLIQTFIILAGLLGSGCLAGPTIRPNDIQVLPARELQERLPSIKLGSFDLSTSHINDILIDLSQKSPLDPNTVTQSSLTITCLECTTSGTATITTTGVSKDTDVIDDIKSFFENPLDLIAEAFGLNIKISFENVAGHFSFGIEATENITYSLPIFSSSTPLGAAVSEDVSFGMVLFVDLVFSLSESVDMQAGFEFAFPEGAFVVVDPLLGDIVDHGFNGGDTNALPIVITSGSATFKAALRVRVQAGTTVILFGTGFDFELGIFADLIEYQATISSTPACELSITEGLDVNIGAFAHAVGEINYSKFGVSPAVVTTILEVPLPSLCLTRPTVTATEVVASPTGSVVSATLTSTVIQLPSTIFSLSTGPLVTHVVSIPTNTSTGGLFLQFSSTASATMIKTASSIPSSVIYTPLVANGTITSAPALTTSTLYTTEIITLTSCADTVLHCPAGHATEVVITSTRILYTTICPVGAILPSTIPTTIAQTALTSPSSPSVGSVSNTTRLNTSHNLLTKTTTLFRTSSLPFISPSRLSTSQTQKPSELIISTTIPTISPLPLKLTPCATPHVETIYTPTFTNPVYTMPTATVFAVPYPEWNVTYVSSLESSLSSSSSRVEMRVSTVSIKPLVIPTSTARLDTTYELPTPVLTPVVHGLEDGGRGGGNGSTTVSATERLTTPTGSLTPFTGEASGAVGSGSVFALVMAMGVGTLVLW